MIKTSTNVSGVVLLVSLLRAIVIITVTVLICNTVLTISERHYDVELGKSLIQLQLELPTYPPLPLEDDYYQFEADNSLVY